MLYLSAQTKSAKVFGHKLIQKFCANNVKTRFRALGALPGDLRPDPRSIPTDFPKLVRFDFGQVSTTMGDIVVGTDSQTILPLTHQILFTNNTNGVHEYRGELFKDSGAF